MKNDDEPNVWITALKLLVGAIVLIGGTGLALWWVDSEQERAQLTDTSKPQTSDWGISSDSPIRNKR